MKSPLLFLERRLRFLAIPHLTALLVLGQAFCWVMMQLDPSFVDGLILDPELVREGQYWRLATFLFFPPGAHPVFILFAFYLFWLMGEALERAWGDFRYTCFIFIGYAATVAAGLSLPAGAAFNTYLMGSVFLAFAFLYPNFELCLFFILPVKIKWLALATWITYAWMLLFGGMEDRLLIAAACLNFFLFFGAELWGRVRLAHRRQRFGSRVAAMERAGLHRCAVCGIGEKERPDAEFRVCSQCADGSEYCEEHIRNHEHRQ